MKPVFGYDGLRQRPNYDQKMKFLQGEQPIMRYPERFAKQWR